MALQLTLILTRQTKFTALVLYFAARDADKALNGLADRIDGRRSNRRKPSNNTIIDKKKEKGGPKEKFFVAFVNVAAIR